MSAIDVPGEAWLAHYRGVPETVAVPLKSVHQAFDGRPRARRASRR
jgi:hypothetical protein